MENSEKEDLIQKLLDRQLNEAESEQLGQAIRDDPQLAEEVKFRIGLRTGLEQENRAESITSLKKFRRKRLLNRALIGGVITLLVSSFIYLAWRASQPHIPPSDAQRLLNKVIAYGIERGDLGTTASELGWQDALGVAITRPEMIEVAYADLKSRLATPSECRDITESFYLGALELYYRDDPRLAADYLACITNNIGPDYKNASKLPLLIIEGLQADSETFTAAFQATGFPIDTLPANLTTLVIQSN